LTDIVTRGIARVASVATVCLALAACGSRPRTNLLVVTIDTLRADHLGATGFAPAATPHLDALARDALFFADAMAPAPLTLPSHCSLFTGLLPPVHGVRDNEPFPLSPEQQTLAETLRAAGYRTAAFLGGEPLQPGCGLEQGFDTYEFSPPRSEPGSPIFREVRADRVARRGIAWLEQARAPFFLWLHFFDPHAPYDPPEPYRSRFADHPYDGEIAFVDAMLGEVLAALERTGQREHTLIVVAADHGESLGEHGESTHGFLVYQSTLRVPLLFCGPGFPHRAPDPRVARLIDVVPTVLAALDLPDAMHTQGVSLLSEDPGAAYAESLYAYHHLGWAQLTALRAGAQKRIEGSASENFDLTTDPGETLPLADAPPWIELAHELAAMRAQERTATGAPSLLSPVGYLSSPRSGTSLAFVSSEANAKLRSPASGMELVQRFQDGVTAIAQKQGNRALVLLDGVLESDPSNPAFRFWAARANHQIGLLEHRHPLVERAIELYDGLVRDGRTDALDLTLKARGELHRHDEAVAMGERALASGTGDAYTPEILALVYLDRGNPTDRDRAIALLEEAIRRKPDNLRALQALGGAYRDADRASEAQAIERAIERLVAPPEGSAGR
jgi:arylsulfatase A-like enzyme